MQLLEERIARDAKIPGPDILKVDMFLNHQIDTDLLWEMGMEFHKLFASENITKILTVEASGIAIACFTAKFFHCPVVFAKKGNHRNVGDNVFTADVFSFTKGSTCTIQVSKDYITSADTVLIIDDFLADGNASLGLKSIIDQAGARLAGIGIAIEKGFQPGGKMLRDSGINVQSLAIIESMDENGIVFAH
ncbi:MAG: xanthine phosphoribosyltransferase [Clostridiales bacterium]|nr:xanthine phosphoribosyltransferase [Clostridiales bacterium]